MVTDGDIRRCILKNMDLNDPISAIMNTSPTSSLASEPKEVMLGKLKKHSIYHLPLVDNHNCVIGFETIDGLLATTKKSNLIMVMAGGLGKRLHPLTEDCPKPLLKVAGRPVLEILLTNFIKAGFRRFCFAVNYKSQRIKDYFGEGERWGANISYLQENDRLGTAGALSLLPQPPQEAFFVINADVVTNIDFQCLLEYHQESQVDATLCIREHEQTVPFGVVQRDEHTQHLINIVEKPVKQFFVSAGIYILEPHLLSMLKSNVYCDMPDLLTSCVKQDYRVATFPIREYWLDIGRHEDLQRADSDYEKVF
jgi:NDP-sugar pyrophosphorylase family protein